MDGDFTQRHSRQMCPSHSARGAWVNPRRVATKQRSRASPPLSSPSRAVGCAHHLYAPYDGTRCGACGRINALPDVGCAAQAPVTEAEGPFGLLSRQVTRLPGDAADASYISLVTHAAAEAIAQLPAIDAQLGPELTSSQSSQIPVAAQSLSVRESTYHAVAYVSVGMR